MPLSLEEFVRRWKINAHTERQGAQPHFIDLCDMLGQPHPAAADAVGERYAFEKALTKISGGKGFADVWLRDHFAWEYKGPHKDLKAAYRQINDYREDLGNPPLLVVCDFDRFEVHTNFTSTSKRVYAFNLDDLARNVVTASSPLPPLEVLRALFGDTGALRPSRTDARVTQDAAKVFARLAERLEIEKRSLTDSPIHTREEIAHFLMRLLFCLFADNIELLPNHCFRNLLQSDDRFSPRTFLRKLRLLFQAMSEREGIFGEHTIKYFNGGLFDSDSVIDLDVQDLAILHQAATSYNWSWVAPEIFGTLFERSLNAERRSLIGAHYTAAEDILLLIEPVVMRPLERRWHAVRDSILTVLHADANTSPNAVILSAAEGPRTPQLTATAQTLSPTKPQAAKRKPPTPSLLTSNPEAETLLAAWFDELAAVRILDPACGSGNFLYLTLRRLLDLWNEALTFAVHHNIQLAIAYAKDHMPSPQQLYGIETEFYAHELASIVVWIGFIQWKREHSIIDNKQPILERLPNIEHADAILRYDADGNPYEPTWPQADFIIGNPPFLGGKLLRRELGDGYVDDLFKIYEGEVKAESDLVIYWFEKARVQLASKKAKRAGLLATQGIRGGANRAVLDRIQQSGRIFWAWSDRKWLLQGAAVHVSMIAFAPEVDGALVLDGETVSDIHADLTSGSNIAGAVRLKENEGICFMGTTKVGAFDIDPETARKMIAAPINPNGRPNSDVVRPWVNAADITGRPRGMFVIDFGTSMPAERAAMYELPFEYAKHHVQKERSKNKRASYAEKWWIHGEPRPDLRAAIVGLSRFIATPSVSKHRLFTWLESSVLPDHAAFVFARDDDYFFGVLYSSAHEAWARAQGTQLREVESGFRYTPKSTFDTFPFPYPPGTEPTEADSPIVPRHRRRRPQPRPAPRRLAQSDQRLRSRPERTHPHQALQQARQE